MKLSPFAERYIASDEGILARHDAITSQLERCRSQGLERQAADLVAELDAYCKSHRLGEGGAS